MNTVLENSGRLLSGLCLIILAACTAYAPASDTPQVAIEASPIPIDSLVTTAWLSQHLDAPDLVILDANVVVEMDESGVRSLSGRSQYEQGHIPGAGFADLKGELRDGNSELEFDPPSPEQFAAAMGALGVGDNSRVVIYDAYGTAWAARVWWMLRWIGFDNAAVLDGGLQAWTAEGRPLTSSASTEPARQLSIKLRPEVFSDRDEVFAAIDNDAVTIIDAMPEAHYRGEMQMYARTGHVPGAINLPSFNLLDADGRYKSMDELDMMIEAERNKRTITYCGGGISASSDAFILHRLGFKNVAVYSPSMQEWSANPENPLVKSP